MPKRRSTKSPDILDALRQYLAEGVTGAVSTTSRGYSGYRVFLMQGEVLAAQGPEDGHWLVRRLVNNGAITEKQGMAFIAALEEGSRFEELMLGHVPDDLFLDLLHNRFRENLLEFAFARGRTRFEPMEAVFVDNIQVGHDSEALLKEVRALRERVADLRRRLQKLTLRPGPSMPRSQDEARLMDLCDPAIQLRDLVTYSPYEAGPTLSVVQDMLDAGSLVGEAAAKPLDEAPTLDDEPGSADLERADTLPPEALEQADSLPDDPAPTEEAPRDVAVAGPDPAEAAFEDEAAAGAPAGPSDAEEQERATTLPPHPPDAGVQEDETLDAFAGEDEPSFDGDPWGDEDGEASTSTETFQRTAEGAEEEGGPGSPLEAAIRRARAAEARRAEVRERSETVDTGMVTEPAVETPIVDPVVEAPAQGDVDPFADQEVEEDLELAFFQDQDYYRGGGADGDFVVEDHLLDVVDLREETLAQERARHLAESLGEPGAFAGDEDEDSDIIEMGEAEGLSEEELAAATLSFGAPALAEVDVRRKLDVINDVLCKVSGAIDRAQGLGSGQSCIQLLLDGAPASYAVLYQGLQASREGRFDVSGMLRNLRRRPESEHRRLLNQGLMDLIQRALSSAVEELEDEAVDGLLQEIAGYQQQLRS